MLTALAVLTAFAPSTPPDAVAHAVRSGGGAGSRAGLRVQVAAEPTLADVLRGLGASDALERSAAERALARLLLAAAGVAPADAPPGDAAGGDPATRDPVSGAPVVRGAALGGPAARRSFVEAVAAALRSAPGSPSADSTGQGTAAATLAAERGLGSALAADGRLFGLTVAFAQRSEVELARAGRAGLAGQLARWSVSAFDEPETAAFDQGRRAFFPPIAWRERGTSQIALDPIASGLLGAFDRLDRFGGGLAPIVVDPRVAERALRRPGAPRGLTRAVRVDGTWLEVLEALSQVYDVGFQVQGYRLPGEVRPGDGEGAPPARSWIHVVPAGTVEIARTGRGLRTPAGEHVVDWCLDAARPGDLARQGAAARALGTLGWGAAVGWLERRWLETGEVAALEGILAAAARGRVVPSLQRADVLRSALGVIDAAGRETLDAIAARGAALAPENIERTTARADELSRALDGRARRFAAGLGRLAAFVVTTEGTRGPDALVELLLEGFDDAPPTGRWVRLVALEGIAPESADAADAAKRVLAGSLAARSRRQALRTLLTVTRPGDVAGFVALERPEVFLADARPDLSGLGLELGLARVRVAQDGRDGAWVGAWRTDEAALSEILTWAALVDGGERAPAPWAVVAVRYAVEAARDPRPGSGPDPIARVARAAHGDVAQAVARLARRSSPALDPGLRGAVERALLSAGLATPRERAFAAERVQRVLGARPGDVSSEEVVDAWTDAAALAADPRHGSAARAALGASLARSVRGGEVSPGGTTMDVLNAAKAAVLRLRAAREEALAAEVIEPVRATAAATGHPLADSFGDPDWPRVERRAPRDVELLAAPLPAR